MFKKQIQAILDGYFKKILFQAMFVVSFLCGISVCSLLIALAIIFKYPESTVWVVSIVIVVWIVYLAVLVTCAIYKKKEVKEEVQNVLVTQGAIMAGELAIFCLNMYLNRKKDKN